MAHEDEILYRLSAAIDSLASLYRDESRRREQDILDIRTRLEEIYRSLIVRTTTQNTSEITYTNHGEIQINAELLSKIWKFLKWVLLPAAGAIAHWAMKHFN